MRDRMIVQELDVTGTHTQNNGDVAHPIFEHLLQNAKGSLTPFRERRNSVESWSLPHVFRLPPHAQSAISSRRIVTEYRSIKSGGVVNRHLAFRHAAIEEKRLIELLQELRHLLKQEVVDARYADEFTFPAAYGRSQA